jgi:hypothetical protein
MQKINLLKTLFLIVICIGCTNYPDKLPKDFSFELINDVDSYNSKTGYFIRKAINDRFQDSTVIYKLSTKDKEEIFKILKENDIFTIPKNFECASGAKYMMPQFTTILKYKIAGITNEISFNSGCFPKKNVNDEVRFENITKFIQQKLYSKNAIKMLPKTKMRAM